MVARIAWVFALVLVFSSFAFAPSAIAQDAEDDTITSESLSIPNLDETGNTVKAGSSVDTTSTSGGKVTLFGLIKTGGWSMWILLGLLFALLFLIVLNLANLLKGNFAPPILASNLSGDMESANLDGAVEHCKTKPCCLAGAVLAGLAQITTRGYGVIDTERFEHHVSDACARFNRSRARGVNYFSILAQAAPMVGLLGTVSGMIKAFQNIGREGMSDPSKLAGNIGEALVTTAAGLIVALPAIFCYFIFRERLRSLVATTEDKAFELFELLRHTVVSNNIPADQAMKTPAASSPAGATRPTAPAPTASQPLQATAKKAAATQPLKTSAAPTASQKLATAKPKLNTPKK